VAWRRRLRGRRGGRSGPSGPGDHRIALASASCSHWHALWHPGRDAPAPRRVLSAPCTASAAAVSGVGGVGGDAGDTGRGRGRRGRRQDRGHWSAPDSDAERLWRPRRCDGLGWRTRLGRPRTGLARPGTCHDAPDRRTVGPGPAGAAPRQTAASRAVPRPAAGVTGTRHSGGGGHSGGGDS
jgi:hypothetical protein